MEILIGFNRLFEPRGGVRERKPERVNVNLKPLMSQTPAEENKDVTMPTR